MLILTIYKTIITINYWDVNYDDEIFKSIIKLFNIFDVFNSVVRIVKMMIV